MSISSSSSASACGGVPSPSSSDSSAIAHTCEHSSAGSGVMCLEKRSSRAWSAAASSTASRKSPSLCARKRRQPVVHAWFLSWRPFTARAAHSAEDWRRHALFKVKQRRERHAHRGVRHDSVPALHVEPIRARLRQLRVVVQELEQVDDEVVTPRPDPWHCGHEQNKSANLDKRDD